MDNDKMILFFALLCSLAVSAHMHANEESKVSETRVIGGYDAPDGAAPYHAALFFEQDNDTSFGCSGSILTARWVLTARHCIQGRSEYEVHVEVGSNVLSVGTTRHAVDHLRYPADEPLMAYDVGVLHVSSDIQFNKHVRPIALPRYDTPPGTRVRLTGWGDMSANQQVFPVNLQALELETISQEECGQHFDGFMPPATQICTWSRGPEGACHLDSGGPLVEGGKDGYLVGIVSWGSPHCDFAKPSVFSRVYAHLNWIFQNTDILYNDQINQHVFM